MSKIGVRNLTETCADCSALEPGWASLNRGIFICDECCSIHRSLGRHISQVKSLKTGIWSPSQLAMVRALNKSGANSIWEHILLDPANIKGGRRKPQPQDALHPTKADFIRAKYQMLSYIFRPTKDEVVTDDEDLSQQLHSSVRTNNLETSLRLLSQGADPNYFHPEKCTTPLHVASQAGQGAQIELLLVYGANPNAMDSQGRTPAYYARCAGHRDLADRIIESLYEVTDRLSYFVWGRKPDHSSGQHYVIPDGSDSFITFEIQKEARIKLQQLPNQLFAELTTDVYDEVDRRETEAAWHCGPVALENASVPFLPVNPDLSATRNQGRQKLARFSGKEFSNLITDILADARRRQAAESAIADELKGKHISQLSDDDPLYDSVASDEDYVTAEQLAKCLKAASEKTSSATQDILTPITFTKSANKSTEINPTEQELRKKLEESQICVDELRAKVSKLQTIIQKLKLENCELRGLVSHSEPLSNGQETEVLVQSSNLRPSSMYEPRERPKVSLWTTNQLFNSPISTMPLHEEVMRRTDQVTKRIQELWTSVQEHMPNANAINKDSFIPGAERISVAVADLTAIFPKNSTEESVRVCLRSLISNTAKLQVDCAELQNCTSDDRNIYLQQVRSTAYDIAKATKQLVSMHIPQLQSMHQVHQDV